MSDLNVLIWFWTEKSGPPDKKAAHFVFRAKKIAESLELGIASSRGVMLRRGERYLPAGG